MRSVFSFICLLLITAATKAQTVEIIQRSGYATPGPSKELSFMEAAFDTAQFHFVASIRATGTPKESDLELLYNKIKEKALETGANAFKLNRYNRNDDTKTAELVLDTYFATDSGLFANYMAHEKNVVYIFGDADKSNKTYAFKIDNEKKEIKGGTYYKLLLKEGQEVKINKGGFAGATVWSKWRKDRPATFLTLGGFGLGGGPMPAGVTGMSFNTGRINYMNGNLGHLLTQVLKQQE